MNNAAEVRSMEASVYAVVAYMYIKVSLEYNMCYQYLCDSRCCCCGLSYRNLLCVPHLYAFCVSYKYTAMPVEMKHIDNSTSNRKQQ